MNRFGAILILSVLLLSCGNPPIPKAEGYYRIELPEESFNKTSIDCGLTLDKPDYSKLELVDSEKSGDACWFNLNFSNFNARLHCTQVEIHDNLIDLMEDAQEMVFSHDAKANGISRIRVSNKELNGVLYHIGGPVATPVQFFITDSSSHFLRGSLYFNHTPNPDSTAPVVRHLLADVENIMRSVEWE